jgi:hypothetical protein
MENACTYLILIIYNRIRTCIFHDHSGAVGITCAFQAELEADMFCNKIPFHFL